MTVGRRAFADEERARRSLDRLERLGGGDWLIDAVCKSADQDKALINIERWVGNDDEALTRVEALKSNPALALRLSLVCGASQPLADALAKNPELGMILGDPDELTRPITSTQIYEDGSTLVRSANSFLHGLDRLRYLRQRTLLRIVWNDLSGIWEPSTVWSSLSALADGILQQVANLVWKDISNDPLPVGVIALGKHGSGEVNYSSDLDLLLVTEDGADPQTCEKFCARFVRALEGKMGRGELYRVDLRLRPMGKSGPVCLGVSATRKYYESYCEPWEIQAMVRARACAGNEDVANSFLRELDSVVYRGPRSDMFMEGLVEAKHRYEQEIASRGEAASNIKLGPGGIRDVEFVVQIYQLTLADAQPSLRGAAVCPAIEVLQAIGVMPTKHSETLRTSYKFFRQAEHRIQLRQELQRHTLPSDLHERQVLAKLMGFASWSGLEAELRRRRSLVRSYLETVVPALARIDKTEKAIAEALRLDPGDPVSTHAAKLFAASDSPKALALEVVEDPATADRVRMISSRAPRVISDLAFHKGLWDVAFGEEVEYDEADDVDPGEKLKLLLAENVDWRAALESALRRGTVLASLKSAFHGDPIRTFGFLTSFAEAALLQSLDKIGGADIDIVALGRLGSRELLIGSDWDVMLLARSQEIQPAAERMAQEWVRAARSMAVSSGHFPLDVRFRPEGGAGLMVRSPGGLINYADTAMESWEKLAFTRARSLRNWVESEEVVKKSWSDREWSLEQETEILTMRKRVQTERMRTWEATRDIKLGVGTMLDIEWLVGILRLRHPEAVKQVWPSHKMAQEFAAVGGLSNDQGELLSNAHIFYSSLRNAMYLLDFDSDSVLPENPEKLTRLAAHVGIDSGNDLLALAGKSKKEVSAIFAEVIGPE